GMYSENKAPLQRNYVFHFISSPFFDSLACFSFFTVCHLQGICRFGQRQDFFKIGQRVPTLDGYGCTYSANDRHDAMAGESAGRILLESKGKEVSNRRADVLRFNSY